MIVFRLIVKHKIIVSITETFSKMVSTLCQKWLTIFLSESLRFCIVRSI